MPASTTDLLAALQNAVQAINGLNTTIKTFFPQVTGGSTVVPTGGTITFTSSQAKSFLTVVTSSGFSGKVALY